jgi:GTP-sensing pleiotropic transcriptional regulator CodY
MTMSDFKEVLNMLTDVMQTHLQIIEQQSKTISEISRNNTNVNEVLRAVKEQRQISEKLLSNFPDFEMREGKLRELKAR